MSWICVECSQHHSDRLETLGFGLCRDCEIKVKERKAKQKAAFFASRKKKMKK